MARSPVLLAVLIATLGRVSPVRADKPARFEFTRMVAHWDRYGDLEYLKFVREAQPEVAQVGFPSGASHPTASTPSPGRSSSSGNRPGLTPGT
jgi:hypothetical protein